MRVHHLNCGTLCPFGARAINGAGGLVAPARITCHCLLVESAAGLVLVDTGFGLADIANPARQLGRPFVATMRPRLDPAETAVRQLARLGFAASDVRHIALTHLDVDHAGGLADFPSAAVHVLTTEHAAAMAPRSFNERQRYRRLQWAHSPKWRLHSPVGERWMGFESVRALGDGVEPEILLVPLGGHTRGHAGVAVNTGAGWLLHCGDAYFYRDEVATPPVCPPGLRAFQRLMAVENRARVANQERLRELRRDHGGEVTLFPAHDAVQFDEMAAAAGATAVL